MIEHTSTDPIATLTRLRPDVDLDAEWDVARRGAVLADILAAVPADRRESRGSRRRWPVLAGAVAACAAAAVAGLVLPGGSPGGPTSAAAATLDRLAVIAGTSGGVVGPGQYAYSDARHVQTFSADDVAHGTPPVTVQTIRTWTAGNGDVWGLQGGCLQHWPYDNAATTAGGNYDGLDAAQYAMLPTAPAALAGYLDVHPSGDNRGNLNRFVSVSDLVDSGLTTPELRAAAIRVLAQTDGITVDPSSHDVLGRDAIEVDFTYTGGATVSSLYFAPTTSVLLETESRQNGNVDDREVVRATRVVDSLPDRPGCG